MIVNVHEAETHLSTLIAKFLNGEEIIIAQNGKPILKFEKITSTPPTERPIGFFNCDIDMTSFDDPIPGLEEYQ